MNFTSFQGNLAIIILVINMFFLYVMFFACYGITSAATLLKPPETTKRGLNLNLKLKFGPQTPSQGCLTAGNLSQKQYLLSFIARFLFLAVFR